MYIIFPILALNETPIHRKIMILKQDLAEILPVCSYQEKYSSRG